MQLKKLNEEIASLSTEFSNKLLAATKAGAYVTTDKAALAGFSDAQIAAAAEAAKGRKVDGYVIPLQNTTQQPDLVNLSNRSTRPGPVREFVEPRRKGRRQRYARDHREDRSASRAESEAARLSQLSPPGSWKTRWPKLRKPR